MINVDRMKRLRETERENKALKSTVADQQATMEYMAMMTDVDISAGATENQDEVVEGSEG